MAASGEWLASDYFDVACFSAYKTVARACIDAGGAVGVGLWAMIFLSKNDWVFGVVCGGKCGARSLDVAYSDQRFSATCCGCSGLCCALWSAVLTDDSGKKHD